VPECYNETIDKVLEFGLWQITESENELREGLFLSEEAQKRLSLRKSNTHRKGYLAVRQLLKKHNIEPKLHQYESNGAPYLTDNRFLSISHTKNIAAVAIANIPIGIDVEEYQDKIIPISNRFMNPEEKIYMKPPKLIEKYTQIWTAKEAIYKVFNTPGIHFANQIYIQPFTWGARKGEGQLIDKTLQHDFYLHFFDFKNYCVTIASPKQKSI